MIGNNMFVYCGNTPVNRADSRGQMWQFVPGTDPRNYVYGGGDGVSFHLRFSKKSPVNYDSCAYNTYAIRSNTAAHDGSIGNYYTPSPTSISNFTPWGTIPGSSIDVYDTTTSSSYNLNGSKNSKYVTGRGWTDASITRAINQGKKGESINRANGAWCTVYCYNGIRNKYVVIENSSRALVQVSDFNDEGWIPDRSIIWDP